MSFLWDIGKQEADRRRGVSFGAIPFDKRVIKNLYENLKSLLMPLKGKWTGPNVNDGLERSLPFL